MQPRLNKYYPFLVWISILLISPTLATIWNGIAQPWDFDSGYLLMPPAMAIGGAIVSLPGFGLFFLSFKHLPKLVEQVMLIKMLLIIICLLLTVLTIYFLVDIVFMEPSNSDGFRVFLSYIITVPACILAFKMYK